VLNQVDFTKGCYLGQELTIRTHHRGVTRKRIVPVSFNSDKLDLDDSFNAHIPIGTELFGSKGSTRSLGKVLSTFKNLGLAMVRLSNLDDLHVKLGGSELPVHPHIPEWWPKELLSNIE
jgi:folate-binding Fe-S cluster repair protein YgfZ